MYQRRIQVLCNAIMVDGEYILYIPYTTSSRVSVSPDYVGRLKFTTGSVGRRPEIMDNLCVGTEISLWGEELGIVGWNYDDGYIIDPPIGYWDSHDRLFRGKLTRPLGHDDTVPPPPIWGFVPYDREE